MVISNIVILAVALALDAFGVAIGIGCGKKLELKERVSIIFSFGFFQFFFVLVGGLLGNFINSNFFNISGFVSGIVILILGIILLKEGSEDEEECVYYNLKFWTYIILGVSVSIDALGVGFSILYKYQWPVLTVNSIIVGLITLILTASSLVVVNYIRNFKIIETYSEYIGGIILILFGLKMIF